MNIANLEQLWRERNPRERWLIGLGLPLLLLALLYAYLWLPVQKERARLQRTLPELRASAAQLHQQAQEVQTLRQRVPASEAAANPADPVTVMRQAATEAGLPAPQIQPDNTGRLRVRFEQVTFNPLIQWLDILQRQHGLKVETLELGAAAGGPGRVNAQIAFAGGGT